MSRVTKATAAEKAEYQRTQPVYPLYGWMRVPDATGKLHRCAVEDLRGSWSAPDPVYEVMAPTGMWFVSSYTHSLLAHSLRDCVQRQAGEYLEEVTK